MHAGNATSTCFSKSDFGIQIPADGPSVMAESFIRRVHKAF